MGEYGRWLVDRPHGKEPVITGISGRLPESENIYEFRDNLFSKKDMVTEDDRRWNIDHPEIPKRAGKIKNIDKFDCGFFGFHYRHADVLNPMVGILLETAIESIIDAGINPVELKGSKTGVFIGMYAYESEILAGAMFESTPFTVKGVLRFLIPNMVSYHLKLKGPSIGVDAGCSSSLHAFDLAVQAIKSGQCDNALVGGATLVLQPSSTINFFRLGTLSKDGTCKVFDQSANGFVRSEAIGFIFLQKKENCRRMYCQVLHSKANIDGFKEKGISFPSIKMQSQLMAEVLEEAGLDVDDLDYLELHGTGTTVGDVQEVAAIDLSIAQKRKKPLLVGGVKSNMGHSEPSSGLCSIFKVILAMEIGLIAPNLHLKNIKKELVGVIEGRMKVVTELKKLEREEWLVGLNNFGVGGTNCHVLLKRFHKRKPNSFVNDNLLRLVCVSGRTIEAVFSLLEDINQRPLDVEYVGLLHQIFKTNFEQHIYRGFTVVSNNGPIQTSAARLDRFQAPWYVFLGDFTRNFRTFGQNLLHHAAFKNIVQNISTLLKDPPFDVLDVIERRETTEHDVLASIVIQIAFLDLLTLLEVQPSRVYGNSLGCKYFYKALTLEDILKTSNCKRTDNWKYHEFDQQTKKPVMVLNVSDEMLKVANFQVVNEYNETPLLELLGRLYQEGYNPQIHKLYPEIEFPVSRGTPMIGPLIKWNHHKSWYSYKFVAFEKDNRRTHIISTLEDEHKYILGHVIDGRNLFPATEYLNIVWKTFASSRQQLQQNVPVVFENCRFIKAVIVPPAGLITLSVSIQRGSGDFVVVDNNSSVIVSGTIFSPEDISRYQTDLAPHKFDFDNPRQVIEQDDIYRELNLRGYNYSGSFKGLLKCNVDASVGLIQWENNWTTFTDIMLQTQILQWDTRLLYVPTLIRKLAIGPDKHLKFVSDQMDSLCPVYVYKDYNVVRSGGIEIVGLQVSSINKRVENVLPVLEKHVFVPNTGTFDLPAALRVVVQFVWENSLENHVRAVEIWDNSNESEILPQLAKAVDDLPKITHELIVSGTNKSQLNGVKFQEVTLTPDSNLLLIITTNLLQSSTFPTQIFDALSHSGFVLTRENLDSASDINPNIEILLEFVTDKEKLFLCRKSRQLKNKQFIEMKSNNLNWISQLQIALKSDEGIVIFSQNDEPEGVLGFLNCIRRESLEDRVKCFLMMDESPRFDPQNHFYRDQLEKDLAVNVYMNGSWGTYRHLVLEEIEEVESEHCYVACTKRSDLSSLMWIEGPLNKTTNTTENETLIYPYYAAVNFKDIVAASGRVSVEFMTHDRVIQENLLGFEFSGKDASGRRVMGMTAHKALATMISVDRRCLIEVPDFWSMEDAATVFIVYATAIYALIYVGRLRKRASVLIHSGTGGVGLAALNICLHFKCEIFVTVGSQKKREYIQKHFPQIPKNHIGNSRDTSFESMIKRETRDRGVDFVLNSLTEEKLLASVRCLATGGSFLEIGKFDMGKNSKLNLLMFEKNISFHGIMLDQMKPQEIREKIIYQLCKGILEGFVKPLPKTVFQVDEVEKSFRYMTAGNHIGKVLIKIREEEIENSSMSLALRSRGIPRFNCQATKSYVIIGGLGGFGLELADWLYLRGATKLILVSRFGIKTGYQTLRIENLKSHGVTVRVSTANVTTKEGCYRLIKEANELGPVDGIFNLAVVLQDAGFENQTQELFLSSLAPKAQTTQHLDQVSRECCPELRCFVVFSSVSCGRGNAGQTNYGMANSIMERICERRKLDGLPALAVQWGVVGDVGLVAKMQKENRELVIGGTLQQKIASCLEVLDKFLRQNNPVVASMVVADKKKGTTDNPVEVIANILGIGDVKSVGYYKTFAELGLDSITRTEIIQVLEKDFGICMTLDEIRTLTFAKLKDMESEEQSEKFDNKSEDGARFFLQYIPRPKANAPTAERIPSLINEKASGTAVVVFPGIDGEISTLHSITNKLKAHVFGACYSYYNPEDTIQQLAKNLLPHIESVFSTNQPFNIIGYSFGSIVAMEVISLLETRGYRGRFIIIDGSPAYINAGINKLLLGKTESEIQTSLIVRMLSFVLPTDTVLQQKDTLQQMKTFEDRILHAKSLLPLGSERDHFDAQAIIAFYGRLRCLLNYRFNHVKITSSAYLFKAELPIVANMANDYGLSAFFDQKVEVTVVEGDHNSVLNAFTLPQLLGKLLSIS